MEPPASAAAGLSPNALGSLYMALGSLAYVVNDGLIRLATEEGLDVYQALFLRGCAMVVLLGALSAARGQRVDRRLLDGALVGRVGAEVVATALFFAALVRIEFANAQTILMLVPFAVTVLAAARLGESVTRHHAGAVLAGFVGVVAVMRPTPADFSPWTIVVAASAVALVARELATRRLPPSTPPLPVAFVTAVAITTMTGLVSAATGWGDITPTAVGQLALACVCLIAGYLFTIQTVRVGDLSVSAPFRYTTVVGAVVVGIAFFDEIPGLLTLAGCLLIVASGVWIARVDRAADRRRRLA